MADMIKRKDFLENEVVDLTEEIKQTSPTDTPLTTLLMSRGQVVPAKDITVTWREKELNNVRFLGDNGSMQNVLGIGVQKIVTDFGEISLVLDRYADTKTIKEIHEEVKEGDLSSGFDGFEIETQEIYEKDEYIQLMAEKNSSLEEQATDLQLALADVYEQMLGLSAN